MWGRFKRKVSRSRDAESSVDVDQPPGNISADIVLTGFRKLSSTYNASDLACSSSQDCMRDEDIMVKSAGPVFEETSSSCKCSPLMNFHKHLFGSLKGRQKANTTGKQTSSKGIDSVRKSVVGNGDSSSEVSEEIPNSGSPVHVNGVKDEDVGDGRVNSNCALTSSSDPDVIESHLSSDAIWKEEVTNPLPVPPRLMRREKSRNGNGEVVMESRKSRLSNRLRDSSGCSVVMPKPREPNPDLVGHCSTTDVERTGNGTADIISGLPPTIQPKSRDALASGSSVSDYGRTSTEPSTADSTDSGIQPSLCSSNDDKGHSSPEDEDSPRIASHAGGPHSDYMLFDDARAMGTQSSVVGQNSQDGLRLVSSADAAAVMEVDDVPPPIPEKRRNFGRMMNGIDLLRSDLPEVLSAIARRSEHVEPDYVHTSRRGEVDYVPVDGSLSKIYNHEMPMWDVGDKYASVPKAERQDDTLVANEHADFNWSCDAAKEHDWTLTDGAALHDYTTFAACSQENAFESSVCADSCHLNSLTVVDAEPDSDDGEYLPPLPTRNYLNADSLSCLDPAFAPLSQSELNGPSGAVVDDEKTHMSWDEVMKEAQVLGIPLSAPKSEASDWRSSTSIASSDTSDCTDYFRLHNRMSCSEHGAFPSSCRNDYPDVFQHGSPSKTVSSPKAMSPFKDKFRLQNLFSKKKNKKGDVVDGARPVQRHVSAAAEVQRRNLPPLPPKRGTSEVGPATASGVMVRSSLDHIPGSSDSPRQRAHRTVSTLTLPSRESTSMLMSGSVWAGSSASVASHGAMSVGGISTGSVLSVELNQNRGDATHGAAGSDVASGCSNVDFIQSFSKLRDCGWYWGPLGWEEAEMKLADKPDGSFLVRDSSDDRYILSLSFRSQGVTHHTRIEHYKGQFSFYSQPKSHGAASIVDFMERAMAYSRSGQFLYFLRPNAPGHAPAPVQLLHPVSRLNTVPSLQHLCRFVIAGCVRRDLIDLLPTPPSLKEYLKQTQYYAMT